jgi:hypothetical protein
MRLSALTAAVSLMVLPHLATAQANPVATAFRDNEKEAAKNLIASAEDFDADKYGYKPTPAQMSFGEILAHEAESNETLCGALGGSTKTPTESMAGATAPKDQLVARLRKSFDDCAAVVAKVSDSTLGDSVPFFGGRKATKARAAIALAQDWADHYAQAAMYLRLNGILPPSARPR